MLKCRRRFLSTGAFDFILEQIAVIFLGDYKDEIYKTCGDMNGVVLDVGCGEGYFLRKLKAAFTQKGISAGELQWYGLDISKDAMKMAARSDVTTQYFVCDVHHTIPLEDRSVTLLMNNFAPRNFKEFGRILAPEGYCLIVTPTSEHLQELREYFKLISVDSQKVRRIEDRSQSYFSIQDKLYYQRSILLTPERALDAVRMGPNYWHIDQEKPPLLPFQSLRVTISVLIYVMRRI